VTPLKLAAGLAVFAALALTYVRSAWVGIVFAGIAVVLVTRGAALKRVAPVVVLAAVLAPVILSGSTGAAITDRFNTFGALGTDKSAQDRSATSGGVGALALSRPLGTGVGSAGEASRLTDSASFRYTDNGYLSLLAQVGPVGFLVIVSVMLSGLASAWRNAWRRRDSTDVMVFGVVAFFAITLFAGDQLFGFPGMIFWYTAGLAMRRRELYERVRA
jgi:O-antigen ligase